MKNVVILFASIIVLLSTLHGCIESNNNPIGFSFHISLEQFMQGEYVFFPAIVNSSKIPIIDINEYTIDEGEGSLEYIEINNVTMLNISVYTNSIIISMKRKVPPDNILNISYDGVNLKYQDNKSYLSTKIYYSGEGSVYTMSDVSIISRSLEQGYAIGPLYLKHGWNEGDVTGNGADID